MSDVRGQDSPIRVSGQVIFQDDPSQAIRYTWRVEASIANMSDKDVVVSVVHFEARGINAAGLDDQRSDERFFGQKNLQAGGVENISGSVRLGAPTLNGKPVSEEVAPDTMPAASAEVTFVQFVDGSTWGDADIGRRLIRERTNTLNELNWLEQVLNERGAGAFIHDLSISNLGLQYPAVGALVSHCGSDAACLIDGLHSMLQTATERQAEMKDSWGAIPAALVDGETPK
ncbi:MAG TPA: hypothetical protein VKB38_17485 [Terracidiphilus sp.]|nr:hypothetical protein [Terracidiphilus sp.]